ncbi:MAG TPA: pyridoxamine 5'-phosphate oxidase family protein [Propionibacteriaceae bacterium]|nr:pyridoxamine 5'-phosphate oxidase family protein [Propionibacteriaceae bacterium]
MAQAPIAEAMSREGKGTEATTEAGRSHPLPWSEAERRMAGGGWFWLATVRPDGAPHVMPLFAAWANTSFFIASKNRARKSRNLDAEPRCVITTDTGDLHIIVEGIARHVRDEATLRRAVEAFQAVYDWPTRIDGDRLDAEYGAPTSGGPPYEVYEVTPVKAFGLPTDGESTTPTRWTWAEHG